MRRSICSLLLLTLVVCANDAVGQSSQAFTVRVGARLRVVQQTPHFITVESTAPVYVQQTVMRGQRRQASSGRLIPAGQRIQIARQGVAGGQISRVGSSSADQLLLTATHLHQRSSGGPIDGARKGYVHKADAQMHAPAGPADDDTWTVITITAP